MAYVTLVGDSSTSFSLTIERFLRVSSWYLLAPLLTRPVLVKESSVSYPIGEFIDPPAFRKQSTRGDVRQLSQASPLYEVLL